MDNLKINITIERRTPKGRKQRTVLETDGVMTLAHDDMRRLFEAERTLNEFVRGYRFHIFVVDA